MRGDEDVANVIIYNNFQDLLIRVSKTTVSRREGREQKRRQRTAESLQSTWVFTTLDNGATSSDSQEMAYQTGFQPRHCVKRGPVKMIIFYSFKTDNTERRTII
eukprot:scaffold1478_cov133-Chaetoceros_neogracile.AAC.1